MKLPAQFLSNIRGVFRERGDAFLEALPDSIAQASAKWGLAHAVLSAWWSIDDNTGWEYAVAFAEMIADLGIK